MGAAALPCRVLSPSSLFYVWAALGFLGRQRMQGIRYALIAYYLLAIHLAFLVGFVHFLSGRREATWQRVA